MSYDLGLYINEKAVEVEPFEEGGTYVLGGNDRAELNVTYNYSSWYYKYLSPKKGIRWLYGKQAKNCIKRLEEAVKKLGTKRSDNYWKVTKGNAGYALNILLHWAKQYPEAVFDGD